MVADVAAVPADIAELQASYRASRERRSMAAIFTTASCPPLTCRYCGRRRISFGSATSLDGHLRCLVDNVFVDQLRKLSRHRVDLTYAKLGAYLGLTANCVRVLYIHGARS